MAMAPIAPTPPPLPPPLPAPAPVPPTPVPEAAPLISRPALLDWEKFMGVKLFAWVGGFALFLAAALFIKYAFERDLIPPGLQVALGFALGLGLAGGGWLLRRREYRVTAQTLCGAGVVILYAISFATHSYYHLAGVATAFALMILATGAAFGLAVRLDAPVVAVLGLVGGFLTPPLLSTGVDRPLALFGYVAFLDAGLVAVALHRRWPVLVGLGAAGTVLTQIGWAVGFFNPDKALVALAVFGSGSLLFLGALARAVRLKRAPHWFAGAALLLPFVTLGFVLHLLNVAATATRPGLLFAFLLTADLCLLSAVLLHRPLHAAHLAAGTAIFLLLAAWTNQWLNPALLNWALGGYLGFAALHAVFPVALNRLAPRTTPTWSGHLFVPMALALVLGPLLHDLPLSGALWPCVLLLDLVAVGTAVLTASLFAVLGVVVMTALITAVWVFRLPATLEGLPSLLWVAGGFGVFFFLAGLIAGERILARLEAAGNLELGPPTDGGRRAERLAQIPALGAILPFVLLILASARLPLSDPSPLFALALGLVILLLGLARATGVDLLAPVALACALALQASWHTQHFHLGAALTPLLWNVGFALLFLGFPFLFRRAWAGRILPWASAAVAPPLHFFLVYDVMTKAFPNDYMGLVPAAFLLPVGAGLVAVARAPGVEASIRQSWLAWFGGSALFFVTLIFPIQLAHQWLTLGWALEGVALLALFHRLPHPGLRGLGVTLLGLAFVRLALNPAVLSYHVRGVREFPLLNWYLYAYGLVTLSLLVGARLLAPPRHRLWGSDAAAVLNALGGVLAFLLLNIEITDYFATGPTLTFEFTGNFGRDMTYSIGWALFALGLLSLGLAAHRKPPRYAGLALLAVTVLKLFVHDLVNLPALYRIGAFLGVAVISILASVLYQRFVAKASA